MFVRRILAVNNYALNYIEKHKRSYVSWLKSQFTLSRFVASAGEQMEISSPQVATTTFAFYSSARRSLRHTATSHSVPTIRCCLGNRKKDSGVSDPAKGELPILGAASRSTSGSLVAGESGAWFPSSPGYFQRKYAFTRAGMRGFQFSSIALRRCRQVRLSLRSHVPDLESVR